MLFVTLLSRITLLFELLSLIPTPLSLNTFSSMKLSVESETLIPAASQLETEVFMIVPLTTF